MDQKGLKIDQKGHKIDQKVPKIYEKGFKTEFLDQKNLFFCGIFLSGIWGPPPKWEIVLPKKTKT